MCLFWSRSTNNSPHVVNIRQQSLVANFTWNSHMVHRKFSKAITWKEALLLYIPNPRHANFRSMLKRPRFRSILMWQYGSKWKVYFVFSLPAPLSDHHLHYHSVAPLLIITETGVVLTSFLRARSFLFYLWVSHSLKVFTLNPPPYLTPSSCWTVIRYFTRQSLYPGIPNKLYSQRIIIHSENTFNFGWN